MSFLVKRLTETAVLPKRGSAQAAGYDLYADVDITVPSCYCKTELTNQYADLGNGLSLSTGRKEVINVGTGSCLVSTGIAVKISEGYYGRVASRSGLAVKSHLEVGAGVIDSDYRGEVKVLLRNLGSQPFEVKKGDRIAQLILEKIITPDPLEVKDLDDTARGEGGFGSTGIKSLIKDVSNLSLEKSTDKMFKCDSCQAVLPEFPHDGRYYKIACANCKHDNFVLFMP